MPSIRSRSVALSAAAIMALPTSAAAFATIPEDEVFARESRREVIHVRIQEGCDNVATDRVEVEIPEGVVAVIPLAVPGWTVVTETIETDPYEIFGGSATERVSRGLLDGRTAPADQFQDFGIAAVFTEPTDELVLPVTQGCGDVEQSWEEVPEEGGRRTRSRSVGNLLSEMGIAVSPYDGIRYNGVDVSLREALIPQEAISAQHPARRPSLDHRRRARNYGPVQPRDPGADAAGPRHHPGARRRHLLRTPQLRSSLGCRSR